ncbi:MAG: FG-GAP repeat domain-containing protein, partial [Planctomycetota bacterium]
MQQRSIDLFLLRPLTLLAVCGSSALAQRLELPVDATPALGETLGNARVLDFDGDGDLDLLPAPYPTEGLSQTFFENDGSGELRARTLNFPAPPEPGTFLNEPFAALDDLDGDGDLDLIAAWLQPGADRESPELLGFQTLWGLPSGGFEPGPLHTGASARAFDAHHREQVRLGAHDLDGDGRPELIHREGLWSQQPDGTWVETERFSGLQLPQAVIDLEGDGQLELIALQVAPEHLAYVTEVVVGRPHENGGYSFTAVHAFDPPVGRWHAQTLAADLDGDGDSDLAVGSCNIEQLQLVTLENREGQLLPVGDGTLVPQPEIGRLIAADYDGDGDVDLLATPRFRDTGAQLYLQGATLAFEPAATWSTFDGATADFDGDGRVEHLSIHGATRLGAADGWLRQQFGWGSQGAWGAVPTLGWSAADDSGQLRLGRALGGATGWLLVADAAAFT